MSMQFQPDFVWRTSANGNHVLLDGDSNHATVFFNRYLWCMIVNGFPANCIVDGEHYEDAEEAKDRAERTVAGRAKDAVLKPLKSRF
jgi:hypothetical protein